jgi:hypothetical protein
VSALPWPGPAAIREAQIWVREAPPGDGPVMTRECALCDHGCFEFSWLCWCCSHVDPQPRDVQSCRTWPRIHGPFLPPHLPPHVFRGIAAGKGGDADADSSG